MTTTIKIFREIAAKHRWNVFKMWLKSQSKFSSWALSALSFCYMRNMRNAYPATKSTKKEVSPSHLINAFVHQNYFSSLFSPYQNLRALLCSFVLDSWEWTPVPPELGVDTERSWSNTEASRRKSKVYLSSFLGNSPRSHIPGTLLSTPARGSNSLFLNYFNFFSLCRLVAK